MTSPCKVVKQGYQSEKLRNMKFRCPLKHSNPGHFHVTCSSKLKGGGSCGLKSLRGGRELSGALARAPRCLEAAGCAAPTAAMQRAVSFLSGFLSEFDYGDPDHDLASFSPEDRGAQREESEELDSSNSEEVFAPDVFALRVSGPSGTHRRMEEQPCTADQTEENWFMVDGSRHSTKLMVIGRDSPCPIAHEVEDETQWPPSSRSADGRAESSIRGIDSTRSTWLSWLRQRWSPLKEENVILMDLEGSYAQCLLERYLTEQTRMHEVAQAELIKRETQHEDSRLDDQSLPDTAHAWHGEGGGPAGEDRGGLRDDDGCRGALRDDSLSHNCGETSLSDVEDAKPQRPSPLSEASTTKMNMSTAKMNMCSMSLVKKSKMLGVGTPVRGGMDGDGLEELWQASKDYVDLWTQHHKRAEKACRGGCNTQ